MTSRRPVVALALVTALAITPALAGCFGNPVRDIVRNVSGGNVDLGGKEVPGDFPRSVPLVDGEVLSGAGLGNVKDGQGWNVIIKPSGGDSVTEVAKQIAADLDDAGFEPLDGSELVPQGADADGRTLVEQSDDYGVVIVIATSDGDVTVDYAVSTLGSSD